MSVYRETPSGADGVGVLASALARLRREFDEHRKTVLARIGTAVDNATSRLHTVTGSGLTTSGTTTHTVATLTIPNPGFVNDFALYGLLLVEVPANSTFEVAVNSGPSARKVRLVNDTAAGKALNATIGAFVRKGLPAASRDVTMTIVRLAGTGNATVYGDPLFNALTAHVVPAGS